MCSPPVKKSNPKLNVNVQMSEDYGTPMITLEYGKCDLNSWGKVPRMWLILERNVCTLNGEVSSSFSLRPWTNWGGNTNLFGGGVVDFTEDGFKQEIASSGLKIVDILDQVEGVAQWRGADVSNPFAEMRKQRARALGLE